MIRSPLRRQVARREDCGAGIRRHHPSGQTAACACEQRTTRFLEELEGLGFVRASLTDVADFPREAAELEAFLAEGRQGSMAYLEDRLSDGRLTRQSPTALLPAARRALVVALPYEPPRTVALRRSARGDPLTDQSGDRLIGETALYAGGKDYHRVLKERLLIAADVLADLQGAPTLARTCVDTAPLFERQLAERAGFGFLGKNTLAIIPGLGSYFHLGVLLFCIPLALPAETARAAQFDGCGRCTSCLDACPTGALDGPFRMDATKCISYLTIEHRGVIARSLRDKIGVRIFGCDACQTTCPFNVAKEVPEGDEDLKRPSHWKSPNLIALLQMGSSEYKRRVFGTALRRADRNQLARNAAIALGNPGRSEAVEPLLRAIVSHPSPLVQLHAAWAAGHLYRRYGHQTAGEGLARLKDHPDPAVRAEISWGLGETSDDSR